MSRESWNTIKQSKGFYIRTYRIATTMVGLSLLANLFFGLAIYYVHFHEPPTVFYATSGITPPIKLNPLNQPNYKSTPLLQPSPVEDNEAKAIPQ